MKVFKSQVSSSVGAKLNHASKVVERIAFELAGEVPAETVVALLLNANQLKCIAEGLLEPVSQTDKLVELRNAASA